MKKRVVLVAFNGELMCFVHVLLNALDMDAKGYEVRVVIEGTATKLVNEMNDPAASFSNLYLNVKSKGLIDCVCKACASKMGTLKSVEEQNMPVCDEMKGHPSLAKYMEKGYEIITF